MGKPRFHSVKEDYIRIAASSPLHFMKIVHDVGYFWYIHETTNGVTMKPPEKPKERTIEVELRWRSNLLMTILLPLKEIKNII